MQWTKFAPSLGALVLLCACQSANDVAMKLGGRPAGTAELRSLQTRRFDTTDEKTILLAGTQGLQDLGFTITESAPTAGVLTGSKQRDAEEAGQVAGQVALTVVFALLGSRYDPVWDKDQTIRVTLTATPIENSKQVETRISFDRSLVNNKGVQWRAEVITDAEIYKQFYERLSQAIFLEAHQI